MTTDTETYFVVTMNEAERAELLHVLDNVLRETHAETDAPPFLDVVRHQENRLRRLTERIRNIAT